MEAARSNRVPPSIPDHDLLRCIGQGSYGEVWLARSRMGVYRAVKIIDRNSFKDEKPFERELSGIRRFEPISRSHEGFVDVLHVGMDDVHGCFYYVMELGDDQALGQNIDVEQYSPKTLAGEIAACGKLSWQSALELGLALSQALAELHRQGLVHRDVKPSNIIFVNGVPKLADIGLVADVNDARSFVGTEGFIPPEGPGTPQADVYGLGKVLYEACTGLDRLHFPELPTYWDAAPEREGFLELNEVILHACRSDATRRYRTARDMHAELLLLANGESVKRLRVLERRLAYAKRAGLALAFSVLLLGPLGYQLYRERSVAVETRQRQVGANVAYGNRALESGDLAGSLPYYAEALELDQGDPAGASQHRLRIGSVWSQCPKLVQMLFGTNSVGWAAISPDGLRILRAEKYGQAQIFDLVTGAPRTPLFGQSLGLRQGAFSPDGKWVVTAAEDRTACVWSAADGRLVLQLPHPQNVLSAEFSPDGRHLVTACDDHLARVWNSKTGTLEFTLRGHTGAVLQAHFSPDSKWLVTTSRDMTARLWDAATGEPHGPSIPHPRWVDDAAFSPDSRWLLTACEDHNARVWEVATLTQVQPPMPHRDVVRSVAFSPDGRYILTASLDGTIRLWDATTHQPLGLNSVLRGSDRVTHAAFASNGHQIVASCIDGTVWIWDLAGAGVPPPVSQDIFSEDGSRYLAATHTQLQVWDATSRQPVSPLIQLERPLKRAFLNEDGSFVLTVSTNLEGKHAFAVETWDATSGGRLGPAVWLTNEPSSLLSASNGTCLLTFSPSLIQCWNVRDATRLFSRPAEREPFAGAVFGRSGALIAEWSGTKARLLSTATGRELFAPLTHEYPVSHVEFSRDGTHLVTCTAETGFERCIAQVWDATTGSPSAPPFAHPDGVVWAAFSPDGSRVVTAGEDYTASTWDARTGKRIAASQAHDDRVWMATFSSDAKWVATACSDRSARVWSAETGDPLTPPLHQLLPPIQARFVAANRRLLTVDAKGGSSLWELPLETKPAEVLVSLARLLTGGRVTPALSTRPAPTETIEHLWQRLHLAYPECFASSKEQVAEWHEFQAKESELNHNWPAALFHWERLSQLRQNDPLVARHCAELLSKCKP